ncbi:MAG: hypothetical protein CM15mV52_0820 [uncultured marine virus]|nr:MAG: hypothetical protein CM15mV52_0820 [uncultured marine virus]
MRRVVNIVEPVLEVIILPLKSILPVKIAIESFIDKHL